MGDILSGKDGAEKQQEAHFYHIEVKPLNGFNFTEKPSSLKRKAFIFIYFRQRERKQKKKKLFSTQI